MRLLKLKDDGRFDLVWFQKDKIPQYAILSHTWGAEVDEEVTFKDMIDGRGENKNGFQKIQFCGEQAKADDLHYFWVDTCCIDKSNNNELTTAINSMFQWYQNATRCYVYLSDVSVYAQDGTQIDWEPAFCHSRWFSRGWTLQELLAPRIVEFYSRDRVRLGDKRSLERQIHTITGIAVEALQGRNLALFSIEERLRWRENRQTTEEEDIVYCLLGIFEIFISLRYGEGCRNAMDRLRRKIQKSLSYMVSEKNEPSPLSGRAPIFKGCPMRLRTFVGREEDLKMLASALEAPTRQIPTVVVLQGMGGQGKTQAALEYCYRARSAKKYQAILWFDATSKETTDERTPGTA